MNTVSEFIIERQPMTCGSSEAEARSYNIAIDENHNVWLYTLTDADPGGYIYSHNPNDTKSEGFAGRIITFKVGKCGKYEAKGPWHTNSDALYKAAKVDLRDKHLTFGCISRGRRFDDKHRTIMTDLLYLDEKPTLGRFDRIQTQAQSAADKFNEPVYYHSESGGGSSNGPVMPSGWTKEQKQTYWKVKL